MCDLRDGAHHGNWLGSDRCRLRGCLHWHWDWNGRGHGLRDWRWRRRRNLRHGTHDGNRLGYRLSLRDCDCLHWRGNWLRKR